MATTAADILRAESMVASSWPALNIALSGRWLLGMADGISHRANSLFFLDPNDSDDHTARLDWMEETYRRVGLPPRVRLSPLAPSVVVKELQKRGYLFHNPTLTLRQTLTSLASSTKRSVFISDTYDDDWLQTFIDCTPRYADQQKSLSHMLDAILDQTIFLKAQQDSVSVATAMATCHLDAMTIQNVATREEYQRQGFARCLMETAMTEGAKRGINWCWIAVENANKPALSLYRSLGFGDFYSYIYASLQA